jgi:hypothetical protein
MRQRRQQRLVASLPYGAADPLIECLDRLQAEADRMLAESEAPAWKTPAAAARQRSPDR